MELKRKIYDKLVEWKEKYSKNYALMIEGARRIGKSTIVETFAQKNYKSYVIIDFAIASEKIKRNFFNLNKLDIFFQNIFLEYNVELFKNESLIIFDEVQKYPKAREAIKYLVKDGRYSYIETGSLISIKENVNDIVIPSEEMKIKMYPLDFEEFLWAANENILLNYIKKCAEDKVALDNQYHTNAMRLFKEYMIVGGMPQSVISYFENSRDFNKADIAKREILSLYKDDINKAAKRYNSKVSAIFENISGYLSTHEKKVVLSKVDEGAMFSKYDEPLFWLDDSMICNLCYKCNDPNVGFSLNKDNSEVKCYMGDTGLLISHTFNENEISSNQLYNSIMNDKLSINKGMFYENVISQMIVALGKKLYFYTHYSIERHKNDIEIDFLISNESKTNIKVFPIEVKSSKNYTNTSYNLFKNRFRKKIAASYIVHPKQFVIDENGYRIPPYMFPFFIK
ncbi:MAG: ATP-binding protein [Clostridia bacterium]|nr:ATP-binding protein [Clostridia bacterium]